MSKGRCVVTVAEAAKKIGISSSKLYQLAAARAISHYRIGGKIVFFEADVEAYLASCRVGAVTPKVAAPRVQLKLKHLTLRS
jgi:excisionase family DNA binding protein